jgi:hypothetical protein
MQKDFFDSIGQAEKNSVRANVFRFAAELGHYLTQSACLKRGTFRTSRDVRLESGMRSKRTPAKAHGFMGSRPRNGTKVGTGRVAERVIPPPYR